MRYNKLLFATLMLLLMSMEAWSFNYQSSDIGKLMGSDGNVYATASDMPSGVTVSGMIAYFNTSEKWGLVISPSDVNYNGTEGSGKSNLGQAVSACSRYTRFRPACATSDWRLPTKDDFNRMIGDDGCQSADNLRQLKGRQKTSCASDAAGIWGMQIDEGYWSSTGTGTSGAYYNLWANDCNSVAYGTNEKYVRPCFTFSASALYVDGTITLKNNGSEITAEARIDNINHKIVVGNGQNACIPQYTEGTIIVPGLFKVSGIDYAVEVGQLAFRLCNSLTEVVIEEGVTTLGEFAFVGCSSLQKITLPQSLTSVGGGAFVNLPALAEVKCSNGVAPSWGYNDLFAYEGTADATSKLASQRTLYVPSGCASNYKNSVYTNPDGTTVGWGDAFGLIKETAAPTQVLEVSTFEDLATVSTNVNNGTNNYANYIIRLTADLVKDGTAQTWTPIGTEEHPFSGVFDGQGHIIKNVTSTVSGANVGLFGYAQNANIGNFILQNITMTGTDNVGVVAGTIVNTQVHDVMLYDINTSAYCATATAGCAGGIAGKATNSNVISCYFYGKVKGTTAVGGIVGNADGTGGKTGVNDCAVASSLENDESTGYIGGIIGIGSNNAFAMRCYSRATLTGNATKGGIVGIYTTNHSFNRIFYCTYLEFTDCELANKASGAYYDSMQSGLDYQNNMIGTGMRGRLGWNKWYYFHDGISDYPIPTSLAEQYLALANLKDNDGFVYSPIDETKYCIIGYEGSAKEITIPASFNSKSVTQIADHVFAGSDITSVTISSSISTIEQNAFANCTDLTTVNISSSVSSGYNGWLDGCTSLATITVASGGTAYKVENNILYTYDGTTLIRCSANYSGTLTVPSTVTTIAPGAFANCQKLYWVDLRNTATAWTVNRKATDNPFYDSSNYTLFVVNRDNCSAAAGETNVVLYKYNSGDKTYNNSCEQLIISDELGFQSPLMFNVGNVDYDRKFTAGIGLVKADEESVGEYVFQPRAYTVCLPFFAKIPAGQGIKVYEYDGTTTENGVTTVNFKEDAITSGNYNTVFSYPYYIVVEEDGEFTIGSGGTTYADVVSIEKEEGLTAAKDADYLFKGTTKGMTNAELYNATYPTYILQSDGNWHKVPENQPKAYVAPFRAYFQANTASAAARTLVTGFGDNNTQGVNTVVRTTDHDGTQHYYNLNGRRLNGKPENGMYIHNGKTYINK